MKRNTMGMSSNAQRSFFGGILMCGNNNCGICNWFSGNNWWWIIILMLLFCYGCGNSYTPWNGNGCGCNDNCC